MGKSNKSNLSDSPPIVDGDSKTSKMVDSGGPFDANVLDSIAEQEKQSKEKSTGVKRGRKPKQPKLSQLEKDQVVRPIFGFTNVILLKYEIEPLSDIEIDGGIEAFTPLIEKYMPMLGDNMIFVMPLLWLSGVVVRRLPEPEIELPDNVTENTKNN